MFRIWTSDCAKYFLKVESKSCTVVRETINILVVFFFHFFDWTRIQSVRPLPRRPNTNMKAHTFSNSNNLTDNTFWSTLEPLAIMELNRSEPHREWIKCKKKRNLIFHHKPHVPLLIHFYLVQTCVCSTNTNSSFEWIENLILWCQFRTL